MNPKSKPTLVTALILHALLLVIPASAWAAAEDAQEIGNPYEAVRAASVGRVDSAVLTPVGDMLYTLNDGVLRLYNLSPLGIISTKKMEFDSRQTKEDPYRMFVTQDEKRIILHSKTRLRLLEVKTGKILKTVPFQSELGVLNGDELFTLDNDNKATVWNADELTKKKEFVASGKERWSLKEHNLTITNCILVKAANHIILHRPAYSSGDGKAFVFDGATYRQIWNIGHDGAPLSAVSYDLTSLYVPYGRLWHSESSFELDGKFRKKYAEARWSAVLKVNIATAQVEDVVFSEDYKLPRYITLAPHLTNLQISPTQQYHVRGHDSGGYVFFYHAGEKVRQNKIFLQFEGGEAAFMSNAGYFQTTKNVRKHLKMKNSKGELVPINDATFEKFNKTNVDHKEW